MGMHVYEDVPPAGGRDFNSLLFMQLLWATFLSGGFHPVFVEKWHDRNAAADVAFVNQTWWLRSELEAMQDIWTRPWPGSLAAKAAPDPARLAAQHAAGEDPYQDPTAARARQGQPYSPSAEPTRTSAREDFAREARAGSSDPRDRVVRELSAAELAELQASSAPALLKVDPAVCEQCAVLDPVWQMIAANFHGLLGYSVPVCRLDCARHGMQPCAKVVGEKDIRLPHPHFCVWMGAHFECYHGAKQPEALVEWLKQAVGRAQMMNAFRDAGVQPGTQGRRSASAGQRRGAEL